VGDPLPEDIAAAAREAEDRRRSQLQATGVREDHN
jgi:hypothetical protein